MSENTKGSVDDRRLQELTQKKLEMVAKLRDLRAQIGHLNVELAKSGADSALLACW